MGLNPHLRMDPRPEQEQLSLFGLREAREQAVFWPLLTRLLWSLTLMTGSFFLRSHTTALPLG